MSDYCDNQTRDVALTTPLASFVVTLDTGGRIKSKGSVEDALARDSTFRKIAEEQANAEMVQEEEGNKEAVVPAAAGKLIVEEEIDMGRMDKTRAYTQLLNPCAFKPISLQYFSTSRPWVVVCMYSFGLLSPLDFSFLSPLELPDIDLVGRQLGKRIRRTRSSGH